MTSPVHPAALEPEALLRQCDVEQTRRSGPGGQRRNKVQTAAVITHRPTGLRAEASERRSAAENRAAALFRLRVSLAMSIRTPPAPQPSAMWKSRVRAGRIAINPGHEEFPAMLAEALDHLAAHEQNPRAASELLGCTPTQLLKLLKLEPRALAGVNRERAIAGLPPLH